MENRKQTVLIVDDQITNVEILNNVLEDEYEILFATSGIDAIEIAGIQRPDIILLDVVMPEMDGYEVCVRLKGNDKTKDIPVIFITAMNHEEDESKGLDAGGIDYITKPIRPPIVKARVRNHLELKRYRDSLKELSALDGLTGIANRRHFDQCLDNEWSRSRRTQTPVSLIMADIDFFKAYNDQYGHLVGDACLKRVAGTLNAVCRRPADLAARYGGEEFVILLPETDADGAISVAESLQESIKKQNILHAYSAVAHRVTLSIGVATTIPGDSQMGLDLVRAADESLYAAKQKGRNRIEVSCEPPINGQSLMGSTPVKTASH
jgi:diguanylate cyclase (GGDEF)-like protein